jgi:hypothetical protein
MPDGPIVPSRFDRLVGELGLADQPEEWAGSEPLREWASKHRHFYFVPERLLSEWRMVVRDE